MAELTKHKAADVLQEILDRWYAPKGWLFTEKCAALEMAISELRRPVRGPETGIAICKLESAIDELRQIEVYKYDPCKTREMIVDAEIKILRKWLVVKNLLEGA